MRNPPGGALQAEAAARATVLRSALGGAGAWLQAGAGGGGCRPAGAEAAAAGLVAFSRQAPESKQFRFSRPGDHLGCHRGLQLCRHCLNLVTAGM